MIINCAYCNKEVEKPKGQVNRAKKKELNIYCDKTCSGLGRRHNKTQEQLKEEKRLYDIEYRKQNEDKLKQSKKAYYQENKKEIYTRQREKRNNDEARKKHAEYCRQPEQREKERIRRYKRIHGNDFNNKTKHLKRSMI